MRARQLIRSAQDQLDEIGPLPSNLDRFFGGPITLSLERTLDGDVREPRLEDFALELETASRADGQAALLGTSLTWRAGDPTTHMRALLVSVSWGEGRTHIRILERLHELAWIFFGSIVGGLGFGVGFGVGVGLGAHGSALFATVFPAVALSGSFLLARSIWRVVTRRRERRLRELLDRISNYVAGA